MTLVCSPPAAFALPSYIRVDRDQFNRRARARSLEQSPTLDQYARLREQLYQAQQAPAAPWADALLQAQATSVIDASQPLRTQRISSLAPRWLLYPGDTGALECLRVSAPFARGGQGAVQLALSEHGELMALRTEFFETSTAKPQSLQTTTVHAKKQEHAALLAAQSPLLPVRYLSVKGEAFLQADGTLHALMPLYVADLRELRGCFGHSGSERALVALQIAIDVGTRLAVMHAGRYVHFDVKPANVLLSPTGHFELSDFGCAQQTLDCAVDDSLSGSRLYMSPEALLEVGRDRLVGPASDYFSLGLTLLDVLTDFRRTAVSHDAAKELREGLKSWRGERAPWATGELVQERAPVQWQQLRAEVIRTSPALKTLLDGLLLPQSAARLSGTAFVAQARTLQRAVARDAMHAEPRSRMQWSALYRRWTGQQPDFCASAIDSWIQRHVAQFGQQAAQRYMASDACSGKRIAMATVCGMTPRPTSASWAA